MPGPVKERQEPKEIKPIIQGEVFTQSIDSQQQKHETGLSKKSVAQMESIMAHSKPETQWKR